MKNYRIYTASLIVIMFAIGTMNIFAQTGDTRPDQKTGTLKVTSGTEQSPLMDANAVLEINAANKGLLLPRLALVRANLPNPLTAHVAGMVVYNTATSDGTVPTNDFLTPGYYWNDGTRWYSMKMATNRQWFFMPSIPFETSVNVTGVTKDLYELYYEQFTGTDLTDAVAPAEDRIGTLISSTGAPAPVPYVPSRTELYYYITAFDPAVFSNISIDANGIMTYSITAAATDYTHINILFVVK